MDKSEQENMVAQPKNSGSATPKGGKRSKGEKWSAPEELVFVNQSLHDYAAAGGTLEIMPEFYYNGRRAVVALFFDTEFIDDEIVPLVARKGE